MKLKILRAIKGVTQYEVNLRTGIPQSKISLIERGYVEPSKNVKVLIANALGTEADKIEWGKRE